MSDISDEMLMAYADGALGEGDRQRIAAAASADPTLARRIEEHAALGRAVQGAFAPVMEEAPPARLTNLLQAPVVDLAAARAKRRWGGVEWGAIAASLVAGVLLAKSGAIDDYVRDDGGRLVAGGALDRALTNDIGGAKGAVRIGVTFRSNDGAYCRTFDGGGQAGLACREQSVWRVRVIVASSPPSGSEYRQANAEMPLEVAQSVDRMIAGEAMDAGQIKAAQAKRWRD